MTTQATKKAAVKPSAELSALEAEAVGSLISVNIRGVSFQIDPDDMDDAEAFEQLSNGMPFKLFDLVAPEDKDKREALLETCDKNAKSGKPKLSALTELLGEILEAAGSGK